MVTWKRLAAALALMAFSFGAVADQSTLWNITSGTLPGATMVGVFNSAINALNTRNSGASAPTNQQSSSPSLGNSWLDTTTNADKVYDGANWTYQGFIDATNHIYQGIIGGNAATQSRARRRRTSAGRQARSRKGPTIRSAEPQR